MAQSSATGVRHPQASAASSMPPQLPLGDKTPRNDKEFLLGDKTLGLKGRASPAGERSVIDAAPASLGGRNPQEQPAGKRGNIGRPSFPWGTKPRGPKKSFPWETKPRGQKKSFNKKNAQPSRVGSNERNETKRNGTERNKTKRNETKRNEMKQTRFMDTDKDHGHQGSWTHQNHGHNHKN